MDALGDGVADEPLRINAAFAAQFDASSRLAAEQRRAALLSSVAIPPHVSRTLLASLTAALSAHPTAGRQLAPRVVFAEVLRRHQLQLEGGGAAAAAAPHSGPTAAALEEFLGAGGAGRAAVGKLLRWARGKAHMALAAAGGPRNGGGGGGGDPRKRARHASAGGDGGSDGSGGGERSDGPSAGAVAAAAAGGAIDAAVSAEPASAPQPPRKRRGPGCGRGRGLTPAGEPPFPEMHPSWQARRRVAARQGKVIRRELTDAVARLAAAGAPAVAAR